MHRSGFSLLEVILALAILAGVIAVLGEVARSGLDSAGRAKQTTMAQLLAESKMTEVTSSAEGITTALSGSFGTSAAGEPDWLFSVALEPTPEQGIVAVRVTVTQDVPAKSRPVTYSLVRWMVDPTYQFDEVVSEEEEEDESESTDEGAASLSPGGGSP